MAPTVRLEADTASRLEGLRAEIRLRTGANLTRSELLAKLVDDAYESPDCVVDSFRESTVPLSEEQKEAMRRGRVSSGVETDEEDVDDILYG